VQPLQVDLAEYDGVEKLYAAIRAAGRPLDAIAIHAGVRVGAISPAAPNSKLN
jgi:NAD(P)-dependent dehydrogenase (short-subunit alcohol dehydrogenase family)